MSELYSIYRASNNELARSMVIKSQADIDGLAIKMSHMGISQGYDKTTWKYYKNLAGEYHVTDTPMVVVSSDTQSTISFDRITLKDHPLTRSEHRPGTKGYKELVRRYPGQESLIKRILSPVDINVAIQAKNFQILLYDESLVAPNEENLITELQQWIDRFVDRWYVESMAISDPLYPAVHLGTLYSVLPRVIESIRLKNVGTPYVSQFHLWAYLGGHFGLARYQNSLSLEQSLWLYRNIRYVRKHIGEHQQLLKLSDVILDKSGLQPYRFDMLKIDEYLASDKTAYAQFNRAKLNAINPQIDEVALKPASELLALTATHTERNNEEFLTDSERVRKGVLENGLNEGRTNVIEVSQKVSALSRFSTTTQARLSYWLYLSSIGRYTGSFSVNVPGRETINMTPREGAALFIYAVNKAFGKDLEFIPPARIDGVIPEISLGPDDVAGLLTLEDTHKTLFLDRLFEDRVELPDLDNLADLERYAVRVATQATNEYLMAEYGKTPVGVAMVYQAIESLYRDYEATFEADGVTYDVWFDQIDFNRFGLTNEDYGIIAENCLATFAGISKESNGLPEYQKDMIQIMNLLTSYNILLIEGTAFGESSGLEWYWSTISPASFKVKSVGFIRLDGSPLNTGINHYAKSGRTAFIETTANRIESDGVRRSNTFVQQNIDVYASSKHVTSECIDIGSSMMNVYSRLT